MYFYLLRIYFNFTLKKRLVYSGAKFLKILYLTTDRFFPKEMHIQKPLINQTKSNRLTQKYLR